MCKCIVVFIESNRYNISKNKYNLAKIGDAIVFIL